MLFKPENQIWTRQGVVESVSAGLVTARIPLASIGEVCNLYLDSCNIVKGQVVALKSESQTVLAPFGALTGIRVGSKITVNNHPLSVKRSSLNLGSVLNCFGDPLDSTFHTSHEANEGGIPIFYGSGTSLLSRPKLTETFSTGIKSIDTFCTLAFGQRVGIFAEAGIGKSSLLGMIAKFSSADVIVAVLVGERGREVKEFIEDVLGEALSKSILVVATSNESAACRGLAPFTAMAIAEYFASQGKNVLFLCDSLTRMARAIREIAVSTGELPVQRGYPISVFSSLPQLIERAGNFSKGSITAIFTVLIESERLDNDLLGDEIKSLLDGHIYLTTNMVKNGVRPAVDLNRSLSRIFSKLNSKEHILKVEVISSILAKIERDRELALLGGVEDEQLMKALNFQDKLFKFMNQPWADKVSSKDSSKEFFDLTNELYSI